MKKWKSKLFPVITLAVCLGLAACGGGAESEGSSDDQEDYEETENSAPESFEGMVKDTDITAVYDMYWPKICSIKPEIGASPPQPTKFGRAMKPGSSCSGA